MRLGGTVLGYSVHLIVTTHSIEQQELIPRIRIQRITGSRVPYWGIGLGWFNGWIHLGWEKV